MRLLIGLLISALLFIILPIIYGETWRDVIRDDDVVFAYISGYFSMLALFELVGPLMIVLGVSTRKQAVVESVVLVLSAVGCIFINRGKRSSIRTRLFHELGRVKTVPSLISVVEKLYWIVFLAMLLGQLYFAVLYDAGAWRSDDYLYTVISSSAIYDNEYFATSIISGDYLYGTMPKYLFCGIYSFYTYASIVTGLNVSIIEHTICAVAYLLMAYGTFYLLSKVLFCRNEDKEKRILFMVFLSLLYLFGLYSHYSLSFRLFAVIWQGKAFLAVVIIPFLLAIYPQLLNGIYNKKTMAFCVMISLATVSLSMMGIIVMAVIPSILTVMYIARSKNWKSIYLFFFSEVFLVIVAMTYLLCT